MNIALKLYATLSEYLPVDAKRNTAYIEIEEQDSINHILERYQVPLSKAHLVLLNGHYIPPEQRATKQLSEDDELAAWPPIAGG